MVQKSFFALLLEDIKENQPFIYTDTELINKLREKDFKYDAKTIKILQSSNFGKEWKHKCERTLFLAKQLGNIYTGSLYNGLISLISDQGVDLTGK